MGITKIISTMYGSIEVKYCSCDKVKSDAEIAIYEKYKISLMLTDGLAAVIRGSIVNSQRGDIMFFAPDEVHFGRFMRSGTHEFVDFYFSTDFFDGFENKKSIEKFFTDKDKNRINLISPTIKQRSMEIGESIKEALLTNNPICEVICASGMLEIIGICASAYDEQKKKPCDTKVSPYVLSALKYIDKHFTENISIGEIAEFAGCSTVYLTKEFKAYMGVPVYKHILGLRISNAQRLLTCGYSVTAASVESGFYDCSNFIKTFKKHIGVSPLKYKKDNLFNI